MGRIFAFYREKINFRKKSKFFIRGEIFRIYLRNSWNFSYKKDTWTTWSNTAQNNYSKLTWDFSQKTFIFFIVLRKKINKKPLHFPRPCTTKSWKKRRNKGGLRVVAYFNAQTKKLKRFLQQGHRVYHESKKGGKKSR